MSTPSQNLSIAQNISVAINGLQTNISINYLLYQLRQWYLDAQPNCTPEEFLNILARTFTVICDKNNLPTNGYNYGQRSSAEVFFASMDDEDVALYFTTKRGRGYHKPTDGSHVRNLLSSSVRDLVEYEDYLLFNDERAIRIFGEALIRDVLNRPTDADTDRPKHYACIRTPKAHLKEVLSRWKFELDLTYPELYMLAKTGKLAQYLDNAKVADEAFIKLKTLDRLMKQAELWLGAKNTIDNKNAGDEKAQCESSASDLKIIKDGQSSGKNNLSTQSVVPFIPPTAERMAQFDRELQKLRQQFANLTSLSAYLPIMAKSYGLEKIYGPTDSGPTSWTDLMKRREYQYKQIPRFVRAKPKSIVQPTSTIPEKNVTSSLSPKTVPTTTSSVPVERKLVEVDNAQQKSAENVLVEQIASKADELTAIKAKIKKLREILADVGNPKKNIEPKKKEYMGMQAIPQAVIDEMEVDLNKALVQENTLQLKLNELNVIVQKRQQNLEARLASLVQTSSVSNTSATAGSMIDNTIPAAEKVVGFSANMTALTSNAASPTLSSAIPAITVIPSTINVSAQTSSTQASRFQVNSSQESHTPASTIGNTAQKPNNLN